MSFGLASFRPASFIKKPAGSPFSPATPRAMASLFSRSHLRESTAVHRARSKRPRRENVSFFRRPQDAESAGFRECLRCRPRANAENPRQQLVKAICRYIEQHLDEPLTLANLSAEFGQSPFHLQRTFKAVLGITPKEYANSCRMRGFRQKMKVWSFRNTSHARSRIQFDQPPVRSHGLRARHGPRKVSPRRDCRAHSLYLCRLSPRPHAHRCD